MIKLGYWLNKNLIELDTWTCLSMKAIIMSNSVACIIFSRVMDWIEKVYRHNRISQYFYTAIVLIFELCIVVSSSIIFFFLIYNFILFLPMVGWYLNLWKYCEILFYPLKNSTSFIIWFYFDKWWDATSPCENSMILLWLSLWIWKQINEELAFKMKGFQSQKVPITVLPIDLWIWRCFN